MRSQYASLCSKFSDRYGRKAFDGFAHFAGMKGREYDNQNNLRLLLVGRSVNGWPSYSAGLDPVSFGNRMEAVFQDKDRRAFDSRELVMEVKVENTTSPLKAWIFVKDKEGAWFQSAKEFSLKPDEWTRLSVRLDIPGKELSILHHHAGLPP